MSLVVVLVAPLVALCFESGPWLARSNLALLWTCAFVIVSIHGFISATRSMKYRDWQIWILLALLGFMAGIGVMGFF